MTAASTTVRPLSLLRALVGLLLIVAGVCLLCWAVFQGIRGPSTCGGSGAPGCPPGFLPAILGGFASFFFVLPLGIFLSPKVSGFVPAVTVLVFGGLAATIYSSRFVAEPVAEGTVGTWIAVTILGLLALLALPAVLRGSRSPEEMEAILRARTEARAEPSSDGTGPATKRAPTDAGGSTSSGARASTRSSTTVRDASAPEMEAIKQLLVHGLANGELANSTVSVSVDRQRSAEVRRLLDLHARGVIDDETLRDALFALRAES